MFSYLSFVIYYPQAVESESAKTIEDTSNGQWKNTSEIIIAVTVSLALLSVVIGGCYWTRWERKKQRESLPMRPMRIRGMNSYSNELLPILAVTSLSRDHRFKFGEDVRTFLLPKSQLQLSKCCFHLICAVGKRKHILRCTDKLSVFSTTILLVKSYLEKVNTEQCTKE